MPIITVPHKTLRQKAQPVTKIDKRTLKSISRLEKTLLDTKKSTTVGVGLAAPQIDHSLSVFCTMLPERFDQTHLRTFINPVMIDHSTELILGETPRQKKPREEGCLSIPGLWGPVPRWTWVKYQFQVIANGELIDQEEVFKNFPARVMQHEFDHLQGILFTDYSLQLDLPVFKQTKGGGYEEVDKRILEKW